MKGYGETHARGLSNYARIKAAWRAGGDAKDIRRWREAALADEDGRRLGEELAKLRA